MKGSHRSVSIAFICAITLALIAVSFVIEKYSASLSKAVNSKRWEPGNTLVYTYEYSSQRQVKSIQEVSAPNLTISGELHVRVLKVDEAEIYLGMHLKDGIMQFGTESMPFTFGTIVNILDKEGKIIRQLASKELDIQSNQFISEQLNIQSAIHPAVDDNLLTWQTEEKNHVDKYLAHYEIADEGDITQFKIQYPSSKDTAIEVPEIIQSFSDKSLGILGSRSDKTAEPFSNPTDQAGSLFYPKSDAISGTITPGEQILLYAIDLNVSKEELINTIVNQDIYPYKDKRQTSRKTNNHQSLLPDQLFKSVLKNLTYAVRGAASHADTLSAINRMKDWIEGNPDKAENVYQALSNNKFLPDEIAARLIHALVLAANTAGTQSVLVKIIADQSLPAMYRLQGVIASGEITEIKDARLVDTLWRQGFSPRNPMDEMNVQISNSSLHALTVLAENNPSLARDLKEKLLLLLSQSASTSAQYTKMALLTLHNIGENSSSTYDLVNNLFYEHSDESVRETALNVLNGDKTGRYTYTLVNALSDNSKAIRIAAAREIQMNLANNVQTVMQNIVNLIGNEPDLDVKGQMFLALGNHISESPQLRLFLEQQLSQADANLSQYIQKALE